jgi:hypothetical protein
MAECMPDLNAGCACRDGTCERGGAGGLARKSAPGQGRIIGASCSDKEKTIAAAADAERTCVRDEDCRARRVRLCALESLDCYFIAANSSADVKPLDDAIEAYVSAGCPTAKCKCKTKPDTLRCDAGKCRP